MDIAARLDAVNAENDMLRERIAALEGVLFAAHQDVPVQWNLTPSERRVFGVLLSRAVATKDAIMLALYGDRIDEGAEPKIADVFICKMRKKLAPWGVMIRTLRAEGWALDERSRAALKQETKN